MIAYDPSSRIINLLNGVNKTFRRTHSKHFICKGGIQIGIWTRVPDKNY